VLKQKNGVPLQHPTWFRAGFGAHYPVVFD
jgi:hypothetical protein